MKLVATTCAVCNESRGEPVHVLRDRLYRTTQETFTLVRCGNCGLVRLNPRPAGMAAHYPQQYWHEASELENFYRRLVLRDHVRFALGACRAGRALDVGCGTGLFARMLREASGGAIEVSGIDASARAAEVAGLRNGIAAAVGDLTSAPLAAASQDLVTMFHLLEHVVSPGEVLDAARRLLAPGGKLVVQVPNLDSWQYNLLGARWVGLDAPRHLYDFRFADLKRLMTQHGFRIVRVKHFSWRDNAAALATSLAPRLEPVANGGGLARGLAYAALLAMALPFAALESAFGCGASVMVEAEVLN